MKTRVGFLQDSNGDFSIMRAIFGTGMIWAMFITSYMLIAKNTSVELGIALFTALSAVFVGLKLGQTQMENNKSKNAA